MIPVGSQIALSQDLTREAIDYIIEQHGRYGMIEVSEIGSKKFSGTCYSIDKPVPIARIEWLMNNNTDRLVELGKQIRQESAVSSNNMLEQSMDEAGGTEAPGINKFEMSIVEENHDDRDARPAIAEGIRVSRGEGDAAPVKTSRRRR
jgi:hypothetical protein